MDTSVGQGKGPVEAVAIGEELPGQGQGCRPAPFLQYEVREGSEARRCGNWIKFKSGSMPGPLQFTGVEMRGFTKAVPRVVTLPASKPPKVKGG